MVAKSIIEQELEGKVEDLHCPSCGCKFECPKCKMNLKDEYNWFRSLDINSAIQKAIKELMKKSEIDWNKKSKYNPTNFLRYVEWEDIEKVIGK